MIHWLGENVFDRPPALGPLLLVARRDHGGRRWRRAAKIISATNDAKIRRWRENFSALLSRDTMKFENMRRTVVRPEAVCAFVIYHLGDANSHLRPRLIYDRLTTRVSSASLSRAAPSWTLPSRRNIFATRRLLTRLARGCKPPPLQGFLKRNSWSQPSLTPGLYVHHSSAPKPLGFLTKRRRVSLALVTLPEINFIQGRWTRKAPVSLLILSLHLAELFPPGRQGARFALAAHP